MRDLYPACNIGQWARAIADGNADVRAAPRRVEPRAQRSRARGLPASRCIPTPPGRGGGRRGVLYRAPCARMFDPRRDISLLFPSDKTRGRILGMFTLNGLLIKRRMSHDRHAIEIIDM